MPEARWRATVIWLDGSRTEFDFKGKPERVAGTAAEAVVYRVEGRDLDEQLELQPGQYRAVQLQELAGEG